MYVACSTLCFGRHSFENTQRIISELGFNKFDVAIREKGPHLRPSEVAADVIGALNRLRYGTGMMPAAFSVEMEATNESEHDRQFKAVCRLARLAAVPVITLAAAPAETALDEEIGRLTRLVRIAEADGIQLTVSTVTGTLTELPDNAVKLCQKVPGLGLTLDPSHYLAGPNQGKPYDHAMEFVRHVWLRDTGRGPNQFQVRIGQGEIEYGRVISQLERHHFDRLLTVDIRDVPDAPFAMEPEIRKLKYLLESLV